MGEHHRGRPARPGRLRRPLRGPPRHRRHGAGVHDAGRAGAVRAGRTPRSRRHAGAQRLCVGHRRGRQPARHLRPGQPADHLPQGLGGQRQRQLLAAEPRRAAGGLRPHHRLRAVRADAAHPDGLPLRPGPAGRDRRARQGQEGDTADPAALRAHQPRLRCRAGPQARRPAEGLRGRRRWGRLRRAGDLGRDEQRRQRRDAHLPGVLEPAAHRRQPVGGALRRRPPAEHPAEPRRGERRRRAGHVRRDRLPPGAGHRLRRTVGRRARGG